MESIKLFILFLSLLSLVSLGSGAVYEGDWSYLLDDQIYGSDTTIGGSVWFAGTKIADAELMTSGSSYDWWYLDNNTFSIPVNLVSTEVLCNLDPDAGSSGGGSGYLSLPSNALNAVWMTGRTDWEKKEILSPSERQIRGTVHVLSYTLEDTPTPAATPTVNLSAINTTPQQIARESFGIPYPVYCVMAVLVFVLLLYCLIDTNSRIYGNLIAGGMGSILAFVVALLSLNGSVTVYTGPVESVSYLVNNTTTIREYTEYSIPMISGALGWFYALVGVILGILVLIQLAEAYLEKRRDDDEF